MGFQAFWLGDSPEARSLLLWANQSTGLGFHFHHTIRQFAVDTGIVGALILVATVGISFLAAARQFVMAPSAATTFFFASLVMAVSRSFVEVVIITFSVTTLVLFATLTYAFWRSSDGWGEERGGQTIPLRQAPYPGRVGGVSRAHPQVWRRSFTNPRR
jgi:exopolysaccharide production protein ExoQ